MDRLRCGVMMGASDFYFEGSKCTSVVTDAGMWLMKSFF